MLSTSPAGSRRRRLMATLTLLAATVSFGLVGTSPASAETIGQRAVAEAYRHNGQPYVYGAAGPNRFDCSGLTMYVWGRMGKRLPHNAEQQYYSSAVRHISKSSMTSGDLVFMKNSAGRITHVGIYVSRNRWWVAPKTGDHVKLQTIYSSNYVVGRLG